MAHGLLAMGSFLKGKYVLPQGVFFFLLGKTAFRKGAKTVLIQLPPMYVNLFPHKGALRTANNLMTYATSIDPGQPAHLFSLISVYVHRLCK